MMPGLLLVVFVNFIGVGALIPVLPYAVIDEAGASETVMTLLLASFALAMMVGAPILGRLSDYFGRRRGVADLYFVERAWAYLFCADYGYYVDVYGTDSDRVSLGEYRRHPSHHHRHHPARRTRKGYRVIGGVCRVRVCCGSGFWWVAVGLWRGGAYDSVLAGRGVSVFGFLIALYAVPESKGESRPRPLSWFRRFVLLRVSGLFMFGLAVFLLNLAFAQIEASFTLVLKDVMAYTSRHTGYVFTWVGVVIIVVQGVFIGRITRRFSELGASTTGAFYWWWGR